MCNIIYAMCIRLEKDFKQLPKRLFVNFYFRTYFVKTNHWFYVHMINCKTIENWKSILMLCADIQNVFYAGTKYISLIIINIGWAGHSAYTFMIKSVDWVFFIALQLIFEVWRVILR